MPTKELPTRQEVPEELTWDLTDLFESEKAFEEALDTLASEVNVFVETYKGNLTNAEIIFEAIQAHETLSVLSNRIGVYARLPITVDMTDSQASARYRKATAVLATQQARMSFFQSELKEVEESILDEIAKDQASYQPFIEKIKKAKAHALAPEVEEVLAELSPVLDTHMDVFNQITTADMKTGTIEIEGKEYAVSGILAGQYPEIDTPEVRRKAYKQYTEIQEGYENTLAANYYTHVLKEKKIATLRGYDSVIDYLLDRQDVEASVYHRQIDVIMEDFAPVMQKYITHIKEQHGMDKVTFADLRTELDPEYSEKVTIEKSKEYVEKALAPFGEEYVKDMLRSYPERWIDFTQNKGKRGGAFCSSAYGTHPYVFLSYDESLLLCYTLFHELGHAGHGILRNANNPASIARPSMYLIEAPSTFHECLFTDYLLKESDDPRRERYILSKMISRTYFHNFVTHLLEAAYQREVYRLVDEGKSFDAKTLNQIMLDVYKKFWGDSVEIEEGVGRTWMRQPHYYMGLYPYTYSAGLTIATQAYLKWKDEELSMEQWKEFLKLGSGDVAESAKVAGVDITTDKPLKDTIRFLDESVDRIIELSEKI
jgi:oligoendopeptidase F